VSLTMIYWTAIR